LNLRLKTLLNLFVLYHEKKEDFLIANKGSPYSCVSSFKYDNMLIILKLIPPNKLVLKLSVN